jgi:hypothetical protein
VKLHESIMSQIDTPRGKIGFEFGSHSFQVPRKTIDTPAHVQVFGKSTAATELMGFITSLQASVKQTRMTSTPLTQVGQSYRT